jgi:hypothetical protein
MEGRGTGAAARRTGPGCGQSGTGRADEQAEGTEALVTIFMGRGSGLPDCEVGMNGPAADHSDPIGSWSLGPGRRATHRAPGPTAAGQGVWASGYDSPKLLFPASDSQVMLAKWARVAFRPHSRSRPGTSTSRIVATPEMPVVIGFLATNETQKGL